MAYYIPVIVLGQDSIVAIHDNLDGYLPNLVTQANYSQWLSTGEYPVMDGNVSYLAMQDWISVKMLLFLLLNPFTAYMIHDMLMRAIAMAFMFLLLYDYVIKTSDYKILVSLLSSIAFALVATYTIFGLTSFGVPLVAWCVLNIRSDKKKVISFLLLALLPLFSTLALTGFYIGCALGIFLLILFIRKEKNVWPVFWASALMVFMYIVVNVPMLMSFFNSNELTNRAEFQSTYTWFEVIGYAKTLFLHGQYHYGSYMSICCLIAMVVALICNKGVDWLILFMFVGVVVIVAFAALFCILKTYCPDLKFVQSFQLDRFYIFLLPLWILIQARSLSVICSKKHLRFVGITLAVVSTCIFVYTNKDFRSNVKLMAGIPVQEVSYKQFYDNDLFSMIEREIGCDKPFQKKVVSIGMPPGIALYNHYYTIDAYMSSYPLEYKHKFRKVIANELKKSEQLKAYFDNWGSRCYVLSAELGTSYLYGKNSNVTIQHLDVDTKQLQKIGCQYVFSAVPIENFEELGWIFEKSFTNKDSYWEIYLYRI